MNAPGLLGFIGMPGGSEWIIIGVVALLIFGKRLPEVARSVGKGIVEFKRGLADVESEVDRASSSTTSDYTTNEDQHVEDESYDYGEAEDQTATDDNGTAITWEIRTKDFTLQTRKHFPRCLG